MKNKLLTIAACVIAVPLILGAFFSAPASAPASTAAAAQSSPASDPNVVWDEPSHQWIEASVSAAKPQSLLYQAINPAVQSAPAIAIDPQHAMDQIAAKLSLAGPAALRAELTDSGYQLTVHYQDANTIADHSAIQDAKTVAHQYVLELVALGADPSESGHHPKMVFVTVEASAPTASGKPGIYTFANAAYDPHQDTISAEFQK